MEFWHLEIGWFRIDEGQVVPQTDWNNLFQPLWKGRAGSLVGDDEEDDQDERQQAAG
jgi:hypothetical protein